MTLAWLLIEPKAEIEIWPKGEPVNFNTEAVIYAGQAAGDIPGEILETEKLVSGNFPSSNTKLKTEKASGTIRVYNAYSTAAQLLVPNTRFVSDDGKLFRISKSITVPGAHYSGGKLVPGTVDVVVTADQSGDEYNIKASTFSLPGLAGTASYTSIYAKSFEPMSGGVSKEIPQVTQEDIDKAQIELTQRALAESKDALEKLLPSGDYIVLEEAIEQKTAEFTSSAQAGREELEFFAQAESMAKAMVFKKSSVQDFAKKHVLSLAPQDKALQENSLSVEYTLVETALENGKIKLALKITANLYDAIDEQSLRETVKNKRPEAIIRILTGYPQIERAKVNLWPFWVRESPDKSEKIEIKIMFD